MQRPVPHYELKAEMARKGLTLRWVVDHTEGVKYTRASEILNGTVIDPDRLEKLRLTIKQATTPRRVVA